MIAMLTVNSPFFATNSFVPSSGSTSAKRAPCSGMMPPATDSSAITCRSGSASASPFRMIASASPSASVSTDLSSFVSTEKSVR